ERGFSYHLDSSLDMRMSKKGLSAKDIINEWDEADLKTIIQQYGEERYAGYIARKIIIERAKKTIETTGEFRDIIISALPPEVRRNQKNPARKTFTAVRIATNDELETIKEGIGAIFNMMNSGARLLVISFHSLEDRIVKRQFAELSSGCVCPPDFPVCVCNKVPKAKLVVRKPIIASPEELEINKRARSAKLRILEKI
ncbi:MAG: 16S rRNA (cytosine(1402)-N(4))-methyltransferase RsmH, partial [Oscillospiraceae bacterium]|nr:16S rRNA (cytosine(1402)-N(4))-methyltransferase RsmH [Oscillospiraceae bacterium]